jgi:hypothetical protein
VFPFDVSSWQLGRQYYKPIVFSPSHPIQKFHVSPLELVSFVKTTVGQWWTDAVQHVMPALALCLVQMMWLLRRMYHAVNVASMVTETLMDILPCRRGLFRRLVCVLDVVVVAAVAVPYVTTAVPFDVAVMLLLWMMILSSPDFRVLLEGKKILVH